MTVQMLPQPLNASVGSEMKDFSVKAERAKPVKQSLSILLFGTVWTAFTSIFVVVFFGPIFAGEEVRFTSNGTPVVAGPDNLEPLMIPGIIIGLFVLIGIGMLAGGIYSMLKKGGYFVGTPTRLVHYQNGKIRSIDWEQFTGDIEISGNDQKGNLSLQMRTGKMVSGKNRSRYVPDVIYLTGIPNVFQVENICRRRIKENDPTPPS